MLTFYALVDYFNVAALRRGLEPTYADHLAAVDSILQDLLPVASSLAPRPEEVVIRLYGGWHSASNGQATGAREILGAIARKFFPSRRPIRVFLNLADALVALPEETLLHTLRSWRGLLPFSLLSSHPLCPFHGSRCALDDLAAWKRGHCPRSNDCRIRTEDVAQSVRQKLVDTALVVDTVTLAQHGSDWIAAVSNDDDVVPGVLAASCITSRVLLVRIARRVPSPYDLIIERRQIASYNL